MPEAKKIADLGAGTGLLTKEMYMLYPDAQFTLIDISDDMLEVARRRFAGLDGCDIICSALSIHHLTDELKRQLYRTIFEALPEGGVLINLDQFKADSPVIDKAWTDWWINYIDRSTITAEAKAKWLERKKLDRENSVAATLGMLRETGFAQAECVYEFMKFATVMAIK